MTPEHLVAYAEGLSRIAAAGGGPKAFAAHLAAELGVTVLVEDADGKHLATAGNAAAAPASIREVPANGHAGRAVPVTVGDSLLGYLAVFGKAVGERDYALRLTASAIGVELAREQGGRHGRSRTFWERLIEGAYHDLASARDDALTRGITLAGEYVAVVLELEVSDEASAATGAGELRRIAAEAFRTPQAEPAILENAGALTLLVPAPREVDGANIRTAASLFARTLGKKSAHARVSGGVGERAPALQVGRSVDQAGNAMIIARRIFGAGHVAAYDDLGIYPLLYGGATSDALADFSRRTLEPLRAYDEKHQTELERTLGLYFAVGENVKTAAGELNVHRHTVFYRLRQIAEICGCKLESPHDQLTLRLAIAIDALIQ
jgi:purine catabolism regulator